MPTTNFEEMDLQSLLNIHYRRFYCYVWLPANIFWFISYFNTGVIILLSFERLICIVYPFHYKKITKKKVYVAICVEFFIYFTIVSADNVNIDIFNNVFLNNQTFFNCQYNVSKPHSIFNCIMLYLVPFLFLLFLNVISTVTLYRTIKRKVSNQLNEKSSRHRMFLRFSLANAMSSTFYAAFSLFFVVFIIFVNNFSGNILKIYKYYISYINSFLSIFNPIVYMILFKNFQKFVFCFV